MKRRVDNLSENLRTISSINCRWFKSHELLLCRFKWHFWLFLYWFHFGSSILFWICGCGGTWKVKSVRTLSWERDFPHCTKTLKGECWIEKWQVWALTLWRLYPLVYDCGLCLLHRFCLSTLTCLILGGTNFFWWTNLPNFLLPPNIYQNDPDFPPF